MSNTFLDYPDFQASFEGQDMLYPCIVKYKNQFKRLLDKFDDLRDWRSDSSLQLSKDRLKLLAEDAKKDSDRIKYEALRKNLTSEDNEELIYQLYEAIYKQIGNYEFAYLDKLRRETSDKKSTSIATPFFNKLPGPIAKQLNFELSYENRLKTWYSFCDKLVTKAELLDHREIVNLNDIYACRFIVSNRNTRTLQDYEYDARDCYDVMNCVIEHILSTYSSELLEVKNVGASSELIWKEYREFVKDYIKNPKSNGYKAIHACFRVDLGGRIIRFEVQVLSKHMDFENELIAPHELHKKNTKIGLVFDPTKVFLNTFEAAWSSENGELVYKDKCGLLRPFPLTIEKNFHKR